MESPPVMAWPEPAEFPSLGRSTIHLWCAWLDAPGLGAPESARLLAPDEQARAARFHFAADRRRFVAGRALLRRLLGRYAAADPAALRFAYGIHGKPQLIATGGVPPLEFNVSHSGPLALIGVARDHRLGVDIERLQELPELAALETQLLAHEALPPDAPEPARRSHFFRYWTRLEATGKLCGTGLVYDAPAADGIQALDPAAHHVGCLAYDGRPSALEFFTATPATVIAPFVNTVRSPPPLPGLPHRPAGRPALYSPLYVSGRS